VVKKEQALEEVQDQLSVQEPALLVVEEEALEAQESALVTGWKCSEGLIDRALDRCSSSRELFWFAATTLTELSPAQLEYHYHPKVQAHRLFLCLLPVGPLRVRRLVVGSYY